MGMLGGLAKGGMFGLAGLLLSSKKRKKDRGENAPVANDIARSRASPMSAVVSSTAPATGPLQMVPTATTVRPKGFGAAFRERAEQIGEESRVRRRRLRDGPRPRNTVNPR